MYKSHAHRNLTPMVKISHFKLHLENYQLMFNKFNVKAFILSCPSFLIKMLYGTR